MYLLEAITGAWVHNISGDIYAIRDSVYLLRERITRNEDSAQILKWLERLDKITQKMADRDFPYLSRFRDGSDQTNVKCLVQSVIDHYKEEFDSLGVKATTQMAVGDSVEVRGNKQWLMSCIEIVVNNAIRSMKVSENKELTISAKESDTTVSIEITDTGQGVPAQVKKDLFRRPIERNERGRKGFGLLLVKVIVESVEGQIQLAETSGDGSTFALELRKVRVSD